MANHIHQLLEHWSKSADEHQWVLATIIETAGSSYRKAGAMMLINDLGQYYGLLSGGCLESDIMRQARRCWENGHNRIVEYDMREEEDLAWQLGIGCGGMVKILLQPVSAQNSYLKLDELGRLLASRQTVYYQQRVNLSSPINRLLEQSLPEEHHELGLVEYNDETYFTQKLTPTSFLAVFGAGVDAKPVVAIAATLGWQVILIDPRVGYAKEGYFDGAHRIVRQPLPSLSEADWLTQIDGALVMNHNIELDAQALVLLQSSNVKYLGVLGPIHRTERVLQAASLDRNSLVMPLANPAGLRLGGELPESIALSMLAEAHAVLEKGDGTSISGVL